MEKYFNSPRDSAVIAGGGFFCWGCLTGKPAIEQSPDERYCQSCYEVLLEEVEIITEAGRKAASWKPFLPGEGAVSSSSRAMPVEDGACDTAQHEELQGAGRVTADITTRIKDLASQGKSCRDIEKELLAAGIVMSYRTIARRLQGVLL